MAGETLACVVIDGYRYVLSRAPVLCGDDLTPREREVAVLAMEGLTNKGIAFRLGLSRATVATHLRHVYAKLRIDSRVVLARRGLEG